MQPSFMKSFKRQFYIEQLRAAGVKDIGGKALEQATERELKYALTMIRVKAS